MTRAAFQIQIDGASRLARLLEQAGGNLDQFLLAAVQAGAMVIEKEAKILAPVRTGTLKRSIHTLTAMHRGGAEAVVGTDVEYAAAQEFGAGGRPARAYLRGAVDAHSDEIASRTVRGLSRSLARALGGQGGAP